MTKRTSAKRAASTPRAAKANAKVTAKAKAKADDAARLAAKRKDGSPVYETITPAEGPNPDGLGHQIAQAHALPDDTKKES